MTSSIDLTASTACPGCGLIMLSEAPALTPSSDTTYPDGLIASPGCRRLFEQLLARDYSDARYRRLHQLVVDSYAAQHGRGESRRQIQTTALSLMTLCLFVEDGADPSAGPRLHRLMVANRPDFFWLAPPEFTDESTVADVSDAGDEAEYEKRLRKWAAEVWAAWAPHHETIRAWNRFALGG